MPDTGIMELLATKFSTLAKIVETLSAKRDEPMSSSMISSKTGISRQHVLRKIRELRAYGYTITYARRRGFWLQTSTDMPVPWELQKLLMTRFIGRNLVIYKDSVRSTQELALRLVEEKDAPQGAVVIACRQSSSRGRFGRKWLSPNGGLWLSIVLRPKIPVTASPLLSLATAVATCSAIRETSSLHATVKWPNDVMVSEKKVGGILIDMSMEGELIPYAVIGIGVNVNFRASKIMDKIDVAGSIHPTSLMDESGSKISLLELASKLLNCVESEISLLEQEIQAGTKPTVVLKWKSLNETFGKEVEVSDGRKKIRGIALNISEHGALIVRQKNGAFSEINSGTLRPI